MISALQECSSIDHPAIHDPVNPVPIRINLLVVISHPKGQAAQGVIKTQVSRGISPLSVSAPRRLSDSSTLQAPKLLILPWSIGGPV
jgi:hypothetical protein